jgi:small subunit ribosomal protein S20
VKPASYDKIRLLLINQSYMPITSSATKALRRDRHRTKTNRVIRTRLKTIVDQTLESKDPNLLPNAYSLIDRAAKKKVIHPNKAARLKSRLSQETQSTALPQKVSAKKPLPKKSPTSVKKTSKKTKKISSKS